MPNTQFDLLQPAWLATASRSAAGKVDVHACTPRILASSSGYTPDGALQQAEGKYPLSWAKAQGPIYGKYAPYDVAKQHIPFYCGLRNAGSTTRVSWL